MPIRHTSHARYDLWYDVALSTKYRKKVWTDPATCQRVADIVRTAASHHDIEIGECTCLPDHLHLTMSVPPRIAPAEIAKILKRVSTKLLFERYAWLQQHYWGGEIWVRGYFVRSFGHGLTTAQINRYLLEQSAEI